MKTQEDFADVIIEQYYNLIENIDNKLMKSLKKKPYGYGEYTIKINSPDMREKIKEHYVSLGCEIIERHRLNFSGTHYNHWLTIQIRGWDK